jgi:hypothetical protein
MAMVKMKELLLLIVFIAVAENRSIRSIIEEEKYQLIQGDILTPITDDEIQSSAVGDLKKKWVDAKIPYVISDIYSKKLFFNMIINNYLIELKYLCTGDSERQVIKSAMAAFHKNTCIRFVPLDDEADYIIIRKKQGEG